MAEYGYLIVRNPGPTTEIIYGGFTGTRDDFSTPEAALAEFSATKQDGDQVHYLTLYSSAETDGISSQLTADDSEADFSERLEGAQSRH